MVEYIDLYLSYITIIVSRFTGTSKMRLTLLFMGKFHSPFSVALYDVHFQ